jgi:PAS domain S-box-containing protein
MNTDRLLPHDLSHRLRLLDVLDRITQASLASENVEDVLSSVLDMVLEVFDADRAWFLYPCDPDAPSWHIPMERTRPEWPGMFVQGVDMPMDSDISGVFSEFLRANGTVQYCFETSLPTSSHVVRHFSVKSQLAIALRPKIGNAWVFGLHHCKSEVMHDEQDLHLFTAIAHRISDTLNVLISTKQLRESEVRFRNLADQAPALIWMADTRNLGTWYNRRWLEYTGRALEQELGFGWIEGMHPDERQRCATFCQTAFDGQQKFDMEFRLRRADGTYGWIADTGTPRFDENGIFLGYIGYCWDITERKQGEELLLKSFEEIEDLYNHAPCGYHSLDKDGIICRINDTELAWLGYTRDEVIGKIKWPDIITPASQQIFRENFPRLMKQGFIYELEIEIIRKDGTVFIGLVNATAVYDSSGDFVMSRSTVTNIAGRKLVEQQLHNLAAHLQTVREEEKVGISREIHDDLGGTLTALKIEAHRLKTELSSDEKTIPLLDHVESMSQLINNATVAMRNIITGLRPTVLDDLGLLAALEWQAAQFQKRTGINCLVNCIGDKGDLDNQYAIALFRISQEALTNVARHSGASLVEIEFHHSDEEIVMSIIDNGQGMKNNHTGATTPFGIHGMRERVDQLGGKINFDIPPGGGFNVTVILPLPSDGTGEK